MSSAFLAPNFRLNITLTHKQTGWRKRTQTHSLRQSDETEKKQTQRSDFFKASDAINESGLVSIETHVATIFAIQ